MKIFSGSAWAGGFWISLWDVRKRISFSVESKGCFSSQQNKLNISEFLKEIFYWFRWFVIIPLVVYFSFFWKEDIWKNIVSLGALILFILALSIATTFLRPMLQSKKARQWHTCEHRILNLIKQILKKGSIKDLTIENLKAMSRVCLYCFTTFHLFFVLAALSIFIVILVVPIEYYDFIPMYGLIKYLGSINCFLILLIFFLSSLLIITLLQYLFFTSKPTEEQLKEAIRIGKEFMRKYNQILNNQKLL